MSERWIWAGLLLATCTAALALLRRQSPLSLPVLAVGMTAVIGSFYPLLSLFIEPRSWRNLGDLNEVVIQRAQVDYLAFAAGLLLAIGAAGLVLPRALAPEPAPKPVPVRVRFRDGLVVWSLLAVGGLLYSIYVQRIGYGTLTSTHDFAEKYLASRGQGVFLLGLNLMIAACLWAEAGEVSRRTRLILRLVGCGIIIWATLFIAVRTYAAALVLGYVHVLCVRCRFELRQVRPGLVLALLAAYVGLEGYAIVRSTWNSTGDLGRALELAADVGQEQALGTVLGGSELSHPFITTAEVARFEEPGALRGESYLDALLAFVPQALWSERPSTLAERFVAEYYPLVDERGGGAAFSFVAEAWWNLGPVLGPLLAGLALGAALMGLRSRASLHPHGAAVRLTPYLLYLVLLFHRNQASSLFKASMSIVLPALAVYLAGDLVWSALQRRRTHRSAGSFATKTVRHASCRVDHRTAALPNAGPGAPAQQLQS